MAYTTTPLAFFEDEVVLFWPLILAERSMSPQFPLRLRPEMEAGAGNPPLGRGALGSGF